MTEQRWFSAMLRKICLVEDKGATMTMNTVHIFRADDFDRALVRAVEIGRSSEEEYTNSEGRLVRWRLKEVLSIDLLDQDNLDGAEVHSDFLDLTPDERVPFDTQFRPQDSKPGQSL